MRMERYQRRRHRAAGRSGRPELRGAGAESAVAGRSHLVKTHRGWVYAAFIIDAHSRMVVGWQSSRSLRSDLAIDALEVAVHNRRREGADLSQLVHHSDRGVPCNRACE